MIQAYLEFLLKRSQFYHKYTLAIEIERVHLALVVNNSLQLLVAMSGLVVQFKGFLVNIKFL
jgi:hypothetical protein